MVEERATGEKSFDVHLDKGKSLALRVFCDSPTGFNVEVLVNSKPVSGYSGANCGPNGPLAEYSTPAIESTQVTVKFNVANGVGYRTMVAEVNSHS